MTKIVFKLPNQIIMASHILVEDLKDNGDKPSKVELNRPSEKSMVGEQFTEKIDDSAILKRQAKWYKCVICQILPVRTSSFQN